MVNYSVSFILNGKTYHTTGQSTFPSKEDYNNGKYNEDVAKDVTVSFAYGFKEVNKLAGVIYRHQVEYSISWVD